MKRVVYILSLIVIVTSTFAQNPKELFRPDFHYTTSENWLNDPNGLLYYNGLYHMFYQYNPFGNDWGNMSWGHAVSDDLVHWDEKDIAIPFKDRIMAFSGSAVVDWNNTSGFGVNGNPPIIAVYTGMNINNGRQDQRIAYSVDEGNSWHNYQLNPVLDINSNEFRDPKVIWHEDSERWIMVVSLGGDKKIGFYSSPNLKEWTFLQDFGPIGIASGAWECPDLFPLNVDDDSTNTKWVLVHSIGPGLSQYFIGEFDGYAFDWTNEQALEGDLIDDFESEGYDNWTVEGDAFGIMPAKGAFENQQNIVGFIGNSLINTFYHGDKSQGKLLSDSFVINHNYISFLIGGGNHPNKACIRLALDDQILQSSTGENNENLKWDSWDVSGLKGKRARIEILDSITGDWGHINIDHIIQVDEPVKNINTGVIDFGADFYALQSFSDIPGSDGRRIWLAWMNNWSYSGEVPTYPWSGMMSIPREVELKNIDNNLILEQTPISELKDLRSDSLIISNNDIISIREKLKDVSFQIFEINGTVKADTNSGFELHLKKGMGQETKLIFDFKNNEVHFDRSKSGKLTTISDFRSIQSARINVENGMVDFNIFVDNSSIEIFINNGRIVFSNQIFPDHTSNGIEINAHDDLDMCEIPQLSVYNLTSVLSNKISEIVTTKEFQIVPNPTRSYFKIIATDIKVNQGTWHLYNSAGLMVKNGNLINQTYIDAQALGVYFLRINYDTKIEFHKVIVF